MTFSVNMELKTLAVVMVGLCLVFVCDGLRLKPSGSTKMMKMFGMGHSLIFKGNTGYATNCGTAHVNISWTPEKISPSGEVTIHVDYLVPHDYNSGFLNASLSFHGDSQPFLGFANNISCDDIKKVLPICRFKKGFHFNQSKSIPDLSRAATFPGTYDLMAKLDNEKGQEMFCIKMTVTIAPV